MSWPTFGVHPSMQNISFSLEKRARLVYSLVCLLMQCGDQLLSSETQQHDSGDESPNAKITEEHSFCFYKHFVHLFIERV